MRAILRIVSVGILSIGAVPGRLASGADAAPASPRVELERLGTLGDVPAVGSAAKPAADPAAPAGPEGRNDPVVSVVHLAIDASGLTWLRGEASGAAWRAVPLSALEAQLARPLPKDAVVSSSHAVIHADRSVPWGVTAWVVLKLASPKVRIARVLFAGLPPSGDEVGAMAAFLPLDRGINVAAAQPVQTTTFRLDVRKDPSDAERGALSARLAEALAPLDAERRRATAVQLSAEDTVVTGAVLRTMDAALRSGVALAHFRGLPSPKADAEDASVHALVQRAREARAAVKGTALAMGGADVTVPASGASALPAAVRARGSLAGGFFPPSGVVVAKDPVLKDE
jgi:hypothetical protein